MKSSDEGVEIPHQSETALFERGRAAGHEECAAVYSAMLDTIIGRYMARNRRDPKILQILGEILDAIAELQAETPADHIPSDVVL